MDGLASLILAAVLGGTPLPLQRSDQPCSERLPAVQLELDWQPLAFAAPEASFRVVEAMIEESVYLSPAGWLGLAVSDDLALLVDLRVDQVATTPDPARPDPRHAVAARLGVEIRPPSALPF